MKLEPIAKPIKIRIKIGDKEYSDFDSVKKNFSAQELYPLFKDGRLERWLRQIGKDSIANSVQDISQKCGDGSMQDYILFLSIFFDEVALNDREFGKEIEQNVQSAKEQQKERKVFAKASQKELNTKASKAAWKEAKRLKKESRGTVHGALPLKKQLYKTDNFLENFSLDLLKVLSPCIKNGAEVKEQLSKVLSKSNYKEIFEDKSLHTFFSDKDEWGVKLAALVKNENDYKELFEYIEQSINAHQEYEDVLRDYFYATYKSGHNWGNIYKGANLNYIYKCYQHAFLQKTDSIDWGMIFAESMNDWDKDSKKIESTLKKNPTHLTSFYKCCADKGIQAAINKTIDKWKSLAESEDYTNVKKALDNWTPFMSTSKSDYDYLSKYNYYQMESGLGKQILDFLNSLRKQQGSWDDVFSDDFLEKERKVMVEVCSRKSNKYSSDYPYMFNQDSINRLNLMKNEGVELAAYALSGRNGYASNKRYSNIAQQAVKLIADKLRQ